MIGSLQRGCNADNRSNTLTHRDDKTTKFGYDGVGQRVTLVRGNAARANADDNANGCLSLIASPARLVRSQSAQADFAYPEWGFSPLS